MPANSPSIYMSVVLTADSKWKVLVPVCLESSNHSFSLYLSHAHTIIPTLVSSVRGPWSKQGGCVCLRNKKRKCKAETVVSSPDQCQIQTTVIPMLIPCLSTFNCRGLLCNVMFSQHHFLSHHFLILYSAVAPRLHSDALSEHQSKQKHKECRGQIHLYLNWV